MKPIRLFAFLHDAYSTLKQPHSMRLGAEGTIAHRPIISTISATSLPKDSVSKVAESRWSTLTGAAMSQCPPYWR